ncbi:MAG: molybdopterin-guanine dinucleotide biosynthesis protein B [Dehalococcoidia bacterium]
MPPALPVVRVQADRRNAGKTWLARALIEELTGRGYVVGAVKHSHHRLPADKPGSDTDLFAAAGARRVIFAASDGVLDCSLAPTSLAAAVEQLVGHVDLVVVEGFKSDELGARLVIDAKTDTATLTAMDGRALLTSARTDAAGFADAIELAFELAVGGDEQLGTLIRGAAAAHGHLCPGVVLGVRMAIAATRALGLPMPAPHHALDVTVETARCAADAIGAATGCSLGKRNLHLDERGRLAATFRGVTRACAWSRAKSRRPSRRCGRPPTSRVVTPRTWPTA